MRNGEDVRSTGTAQVRARVKVLPRHPQPLTLLAAASISIAAINHA